MSPASASNDETAAGTPQAAQDTSAPAKEQTVLDYDWHAPCRFTAAARQRLAAFGRKAADAVAAELRDFMHRDVALEPGPLAEHYGEDLWKPSQTSLYGVPLVDAAGKVCGMIALPTGVAVSWVEGLLGGTAAETKDARPLSSLESAILLDIAGAMTRAFSAASKAAGGPVLRHMELATSDQSPVAGREHDDFLKITLLAQHTEGQAAIWIALLSDILMPIADPDALKKTARTADDTQGDLVAHMGNVPVQAMARLGTVTVTMRDAASLEPGDILLLGKTVSDPIDVLVTGNVVFRGRAVTSGGCYAVQVQEQNWQPRHTAPEKEKPV
jgi:flagellar motor switch protein FliM